MASWQRVIATVAYNVEEHFDHLKFRLRKRLGRLNAVLMLPYRGYGTREMFILKGRVIENHGIKAANDNDSVWRNLLNMYRRFASDEIRGARVQARFGAVVQETLTDESGYFEFRFMPDPERLSEHDVWYDVTLELKEYPGPRLAETLNTAQVLLPPPTADFGIISDLDDTVIQSDVAHLLKLARNTFLKNARTRLPFEGVAAFYEALQAGTGGGFNPIFYVSSGPWNLYDLIVDFFEIRGIPAGPLFLADLGVTEQQLIKPNRWKHKLRLIEMLLTTYPTLPFILIGDSGEIDPEIYLQAVLDHPGRIKAIYIRDMGIIERSRSMDAITAQVKAAGSELVLVTDTLAAADHAAQRGFILPQSMPRIQAEFSLDRQPPTPIEALLEEEMP
jgi:phosphatidate phosphatase APP1